MSQTEGMEYIGERRSPDAGGGKVQALIALPSQSSRGLGSRKSGVFDRVGQHGVARACIVGSGMWWLAGGAGQLEGMYQDGVARGQSSGG